MTLLTPSELQTALKISPRTYHRLIAAGSLPCRLIGSHRRFVLEEVVAALPRPTVPTPPVRTPHYDITAMLKQRAKQWGQRGSHA